jgi:hypothetical protein
MIDDDRSAPEPPPRWPGHAEHGTQSQNGATPFEHFLGGTPANVIVRLLFVSLIVGAFLMWLDIRPADLYRGVVDTVHRIWNLGFGAIREVADYILVGAAIVVPVWLAIRLLSMRNPR